MAFHPYTQLIPEVFNLHEFGPPRGFTHASTCPWLDHPASGLEHATQRPLQTRFRYGSTYRLSLATYIKSPNHDAKGTLSGMPCGVALELLVDMWFQVLLIPLTGVLFTFPSRY